MLPRPLEPLGAYARMACLWEVTARKPGNVHRFADFDDVGYLDFAASAMMVGHVFDIIETEGAYRSGQGSTGALIHLAVADTKRVTRTNTNLGTILLLVPLAQARKELTLRHGVVEVLERLTVQDASDAYQAIREARPGGLGRVADQDVSEPPTQTLRQVMAL